MKNELKQNIIYSAIEKVGIIIAQFCTSVLVSKFLPREDFGAMAVIAGSFAFVQLINLSIENNLYKEHKKLEENNLQSIFGQLQTFNLLKVFILSIFSLLIGYYYFNKTNNANFIYITTSYFLITSMDILIAPFIIYSTIRFKQKLATNISLARWSLNLVGVSYLIISPNVKILLLKDLVIFVVIAALWSYVFFKNFKIKIGFEAINKKFIDNYFIGYSMWTHLTAVASTLIYKADALILFYFVGLKTIGNYNIALTLANVASIVPSILIGQNNVALANTEDLKQSLRITTNFLILSVIVGVISLLGFVILGYPYIQIVSQESRIEIYQYLLFIVLGVVLVKSIVSPLVSYINIKGDVRSLFYFVSLPVLIFSLFSYCISAYIWGAMGVAIANLINGVIWLLLIFKEIKKYNFQLPDFTILKSEIDKMVTYAKKIND